MNIENEVRAMMKATVAELRARYAEAHGEPTRSGNRDFLIKRIAWRLQANAEGGISDRARRRAAELANDSDLRQRPPRGAGLVLTSLPSVGGQVLTGSFATADVASQPASGTILTRKYKGAKVVVKVLDQGFEYDGIVYRSLSAIAKKVTGAHWNGPLFFGMNKCKEATTA